MEIKDGLNLEGRDIHSFLMIGQSNMAGRGDYGDVEPIESPLCFMLRMGRFQPMSEPVNPDRSIFHATFHSGISLASSFALAYAEEHQQKTGLIPCADGGTRIDQWLPGEILYDHALMQAKLAMRTSTLKGILWHQGESDCLSYEMIDAYREKLLFTMSSLRHDLGIPDLPIILGELAQGHKDLHMEDMQRYFNERLLDTVNALPHGYLVSAKGLTLKPDDLHFDAVSCRALGKRYYEAYRQAELSQFP